MGFCDPCPGEPKQLYVEYTYGGNSYEVHYFSPFSPDKNHLNECFIFVSSNFQCETGGGRRLSGVVYTPGSTQKLNVI